MRILTRREMREAEAAADRAGTSYAALMENAGRAAAAEIIKCAPPQKRVLFLCGKGNNAGDAFVAARLLAQAGWQAALALLCGEDFSPLARENFTRLPAEVTVAAGEASAAGEAVTGGEMAAGGGPAAFDFPVIVDGVFGTGFRGALPGEIQAAFQKANQSAALRVALDLPSGLDCDTGEASAGVFKAGLTLTFGAYKPGLLAGAGPALCGEIRVLDIGL